MASYTPMPYSSPMPYSPPLPYDAPYKSYESDPIQLAPLVVGDDPSAGGGGGGGGGMITKFFALPLFPILFPIAFPFLFIIVVPIILLLLLLLKTGGGGGGQKYDQYETTPYYDGNSYGNDYQADNDNNDNYNTDSYNNTNDNSPNQGYNNRHRRQAETKKNIPATTSSALPSMSVAQVERLTQVVYAALNSQECIQRLLCELGSLSRSFSDTTRTVTKAVEEYVPDKLKDSFNVFAKAEKCEQFKCGSLKVKK